MAFLIYIYIYIFKFVYLNFIFNKLIDSFDVYLTFRIILTILLAIH